MRISFECEIINSNKLQNEIASECEQRFFFYFSVTHNFIAAQRQSSMRHLKVHWSSGMAVDEAMQAMQRQRTTRCALCNRMVTLCVISLLTFMVIVLTYP